MWKKKDKGWLAVQIGRMAFSGTKSLNLIQSMVYNTAYKSNENMLICAPTGAGKTNIAMLAVLRELNQHLVQGVIKVDEFKVRGGRGRQMKLGLFFCFLLALWYSFLLQCHVIFAGFYDVM